MLLESATFQHKLTVASIYGWHICSLATWPQEITGFCQAPK